MFTGIVTHRAVLSSASPIDSGDMIRMVLAFDDLPDALRIGDSVAINGTCLTAVAIQDKTVSFDVIPETLRKTTLGARNEGDLVNIERALRIGDELGGHWVQGHIDGTATLVERTIREGDTRLVFALNEDLHKGLLPKGSVTIDGVSLTVGEVWLEESGGEEPGRFAVYLIPHTLAVTTLGALSASERVNIEVDILGRWVGHHLARLTPRQGT